MWIRLKIVYVSDSHPNFHINRSVSSDTNLTKHCVLSKKRVVCNLEMCAHSGHFKELCITNIRVSNENDADGLPGFESKVLLEIMFMKCLGWTMKTLEAICPSCFVCILLNPLFHQNTIINGLLLWQNVLFEISHELNAYIPMQRKDIKDSQKRQF